MARFIKRNNQRFAQTQIESQDPARSVYVARPKKMPPTYPRGAKAFSRPLYAPWPRALPPTYPPGTSQRASPRRLTVADLKVVKKVDDGREIAGSIKPAPFVLSTFDVRPINNIDFVETFSAAEQAGGDTFTGTYIVPPGRAAIFRRLQLRVYMSAANARDAVTGAPAVALTGAFLVNGSAVDQANNLRLDDAVCAPAWQNGLDIPLYFLASEGSTVTFTIANATGGFDFAFVAPLITGNLLLSEGVNPTSEPGTQSPLPTRAL